MPKRFQYSILSVMEMAGCLAIGLGAWACWYQLNMPRQSSAIPEAGLAAEVLVAAVTAGFMVGRRFRGTRQQRAAVGIVVFWAVLLTAGPAVICYLSLEVFASFGRPVEMRGLSYLEYCQHYDTRHFDPVGATRVDIYTLQGIDGYDSFQRIEIGTPAYASLVETMEGRLKEPNYASYDSADLGSVRRSSGNGPNPPPDWPSPDTTPPAWWHPEKAGLDSTRTCWELQTKSSGTTRSRGWYWLYSVGTGTLWIWEWNYQHYDLEGNSGDSMKAPGKGGRK